MFLNQQTHMNVDVAGVGK